MIALKRREGDGNRRGDSSHEAFLFLYAHGCIYVETANVHLCGSTGDCFSIRVLCILTVAVSV